MFNRIALLVLQEQVRPRRFGRKWRRKVKNVKNGSATGDKKAKQSKSITKQEQSPATYKYSDTQDSPFSNEIFEDVMAEIMKFAKDEKRPPPESVPNAICFDLGGSHASHADVYHQLKEHLILKGIGKIISLQYLAMSFRWKILLDSQASRDRIAGSEINVNGRTVSLRRYDDIMLLEYKKYLRANGFIETVKKV